MAPQNFLAPCFIPPCQTSQSFEAKLEKLLSDLPEALFMFLYVNFMLLAICLAAGCCIYVVVSCCCPLLIYNDYDSSLDGEEETPLLNPQNR